MEKFNRTIVGIGLALVALTMVLPTLTTASADQYTGGIYGDNQTAKTTAIVVGGAVAASEVYLVLLGGASRHKHHNNPQ